MYLTEYFLRENVFIDFASDPYYGSGQEYVNYPIRFGTVEFGLAASEALVQIADRIRVDNGYRPMHAMGGYTDDTCDNDGWYDFYCSISSHRPGRTDNRIEFYVVNADSEDNEDCYSIDLTEEEQEFLYARLDEQCRKYLKQSCEELLAEAVKEMEELEEREGGGIGWTKRNRYSVRMCVGGKRL